jgi:hypothetical protein
MAGCGDDDEGPTADDLQACEYENPPPSEENEVLVGGGATCEEAVPLFTAAPGLGDLESHEMRDLDTQPEITGHWVCQASQPDGGGGALDVACVDGQKRVEYTFY